MTVPQVVGLHQFPVKPSGADINENFLSEEATQEFGVREQSVRFRENKFNSKTPKITRSGLLPHLHL